MFFLKKLEKNIYPVDRQLDIVAIEGWKVRGGRWKWSVEEGKVRRKGWKMSLWKACRWHGWDRLTQIFSCQFVSVIARNINFFSDIVFAFRFLFFASFTFSCAHLYHIYLCCASVDKILKFFHHKVSQRIFTKKCTLPRPPPPISPSKNPQNSHKKRASPRNPIFHIHLINWFPIN